MRRAAVVVLGGCARVFGLDPVAIPPPDAPPDAPPPDPPPCAAPLIGDTFIPDDPLPCSMWGHQDEDMTTVSAANGQLVISPSSTPMVTRGGCESGGDTKFTADGVMVETSATIGNAQWKMATAWWPGAVPGAAVLSWSSSSIEFDFGPDTAHVTKVGDSYVIDPARTPWVRLRPSNDGQAILAEYASTAFDWTTFASQPVAAPPVVNISILGGTYNINTTPITFDALYVCPP